MSPLPTDPTALSPPGDSRSPLGTAGQEAAAAPALEPLPDSQARGWGSPGARKAARVPAASTASEQRVGGVGNTHGHGQQSGAGPGPAPGCPPCPHAAGRPRAARGPLGRLPRPGQPWYSCPVLSRNERVLSSWTLSFFSPEELKQCQALYKITPTPGSLIPLAAWGRERGRGTEERGRGLSWAWRALGGLLSARGQAQSPPREHRADGVGRYQPGGEARVTACFPSLLGAALGQAGEVLSGQRGPWGHCLLGLPHPARVSPACAAEKREGEGEGARHAWGVVALWTDGAVQVWWSEALAGVWGTHFTWPCSWAWRWSRTLGWGQSGHRDVAILADPLRGLSPASDQVPWVSVLAAPPPPPPPLPVPCWPANCIAQLGDTAKEW